MSSLGIGSSDANRHKEEMTRLQLLKSVEEEQGRFNSLAKEFFAATTHDLQASLLYAKEIVQTVDRILSAGDWDHSLFLKNTIKPFRKMKEEALEVIQHLEGGKEKESPKNRVTELQQGYTTVFISLFLSGGQDLRKWELLLRSIDRYLLGRPVYAHQEEVEKLIRLKPDKSAEAYIRVSVPSYAIEKDFLGMEKVDRHGSRLLSLAHGTIQAEQIQEFVHQGNRYLFKDGRLRKEA